MVYAEPPQPATFPQDRICECCGTDRRVGVLKLKYGRTWAICVWCFYLEMQPAVDEHNRKMRGE